MKKKIFAFAIIFILTFVAMTAMFIVDYSAETEGNYTYTINNNKATITDFLDKVSGDVEIPSTLGGAPVAKIAENAFADCANITSIVVPNSVKMIGYNAFGGCTSLKSITLPFVGATAAGDTADTYLGYIFGANSCVYNYHAVPASLKTVVITGGATIADSAFQGCSNITSITLPSGLKSTGRWAFSGCTNLQTVTLPNGLTTIGWSSFSNCSSITEISIPATVTAIEGAAFYNCTALNSIKIPNGVKSIDKWAFSGCVALKSVEIPNSVTVIADAAFTGCKSLTEVKLPNALTSIGDSAFSGCSGIISLAFPESLSNIGNAAFYNTGIYNDPANWDGAVFYFDNFLLNIRGTLTGTYIVKDGTRAIAGGAFDKQTQLTNVVVPSSVTSIGFNAFNGCSALEKITIPFVGETADGENNVHFGYIFGARVAEDNAAFVPGTLKKIVISGGTKIGVSAFEGCGFEEITITNSITEVEKKAFNDCLYIKKVYFVGTEEEWENISVGANNRAFTAKDRREYLSELTIDTTMPDIDDITSVPDDSTTAGPDDTTTNADLPIGQGNSCGGFSFAAQIVAILGCGLTAVAFVAKKH